MLEVNDNATMLGMARSTGNGNVHHLAREQSKVDVRLQDEQLYSVRERFGSRRSLLVPKLRVVDCTY
jgi:hypothetical protein